MLSPEIARRAVTMAHARQTQIWIFSAQDGLVRQNDQAGLGLERRAIGFSETCVEDFGPALDSAAKAMRKLALRRATHEQRENPAAPSSSARDGASSRRRACSTGLAQTPPAPVIVVVIGVSGSGKTTVAKLLATALFCQFQEGEALHPAGNVEKMRAGVALTDADRAPWLKKIAEVIDGWRNRGESAVLACSALKRSYRNIIIGDRPGVALVYLSGSQDLIRRRMAGRRGHFMPAALLDSQFAALEEPTPDERPIDVDVDREPTAIVAEIVDRLEQRRRRDKIGDATARAPRADESGQDNENT